MYETWSCMAVIRTCLGKYVLLSVRSSNFQDSQLLRMPSFGAQNH
jgi:hypothetical protein